MYAWDGNLESESRFVPDDFCFFLVICGFFMTYDRFKLLTQWPRSCSPAFVFWEQQVAWALQLCLDRSDLVSV